MKVAQGEAKKYLKVPELSVWSRRGWEELSKKAMSMYDDHIVHEGRKKAAD
jgi:hypothetical protein